MRRSLQWEELEEGHSRQRAQHVQRLCGETLVREKHRVCGKGDEGGNAIN